MTENKKICENCGSIGYYIGNMSTIKHCFLSSLPVFAVILFFPSFTSLLISVAISIYIYKYVINKKNKCPNCKQQNTMIDILTPKGKEIYLKYNDEKKYLEDVTEEIKQKKSNTNKYIFVGLILLGFIISIIATPIYRGYRNAAEHAEQTRAYQTQLQEQMQYDKHIEQKTNNEQIGGVIGTIAGGFIGYVAGALVGDFGGVVGAPTGMAIGREIGQIIGRSVSD